MPVTMGKILSTRRREDAKTRRRAKAKSRSALACRGRSEVHGGWNKSGGSVVGIYRSVFAFLRVFACIWFWSSRNRQFPGIPSPPGTRPRLFFASSVLRVFACLAHERGNLLRLRNFSPLEASMGIDPAFFLQHFFRRAPIVGAERGCAEQFDDGLYTVSVQVLNS